MGYKGELVEFPTPDGLLLNGFLQKPKKTAICLIHIHGMESNFYGRRTLMIGQELGKKGIAYLSINTRGHGALVIIRKKSGRPLTAGTRFEKFEDCVYDIKSAINFVRGIGFKKIVLSGHSTGCQKILYYLHKKKDRKVVGLVFIAPGDDYNTYRSEFGRKFNAVVGKCKLMAKKGMGNETAAFIPRGFSANRFLSIAEPRNPESRLFNFDGQLKEFASTKTPMCVVFGSREQFAVKPVGECIRILKSKTNARIFTSKIIKGADHFFRKHEDEVAEVVYKFVLQLSKKQ